MPALQTCNVTILTEHDPAKWMAVFFPKKKPFLDAISTFDDVQSTKVVTLGTPFKVVHWTHKDSPGVEL